MKIVSGKTGTPHVTSEQFRQIIEGTVGQGSYILTSGENLEPELASNNMLKIRGGMMSHHGNVSCVELNTYDEVTLTNGSQGVKRIDLIVNRYTRNDETGLEKNEWVVIIGTPDATNPKVPEYIAGNLQNGDLTDDCPVFEVHYDGINVTEVKKLLPVMSNLDLLNGNCIKVVDSKKTTTNGYNYEYSVLSFGDKRYVKLFGNYTIKNVAGTSFPPFTYNTITNLVLFPVNITTKIKKVLDFSLDCFDPGSGLFLIGGIKKHIATTNVYADVQFLMTNQPQNIGLEWMMVCEIE